jgi:hypothetical protein
LNNLLAARDGAVPFGELPTTREVAGVDLVVAGILVGSQG